MMLVPATRLLAWFAIVVVPFATLAGVVPESWPIAAGGILLFLVIAALDAALSLRRLTGLGIALPPVLRATQAREFPITVSLHNPLARRRTIRVALAFPPGLESTADEIAVELPEGVEHSAFDWICAGTRRGKSQVELARIEAASPLRLWRHWQNRTVSSEVRIYPNLARERSSLAALFLNRGAFGIHAQRQIGRGREFEKLREYNSGDSIEDVHWKATAKRGHPVTKVFQIERTQEVYVILDASRLTARRIEAASGANDGPARLPGTTIVERYISAALILGLAAEQQGDLFGLLTFGDRIETFVRARNGQAHYHACRDALYTLEARDVTPDFDELSTFIRLRLRRRALLLFLTSLDDPVTAESFVRSMDLVCRQHLVLVNMLQPAGVRPLFTNGNVTSTADIYAELAGHMRWHALRELEKVLQRRGVRLSLLQSERLAVDLVSQYLSVKQRQAL